MMIEEGEESPALQIIKRKRTKRRHGQGSSSMSESLSENSNVGVSPSTLSGYNVEDEDMAKCLILLAQGGRHENDNLLRKSSSSSFVKNSGGQEAYKCKTCERSFGSFQALGGHRASHKKPKVSCDEAIVWKKKSQSGMIREEEASTMLSLSNSTLATRPAIKGPKVHECSICGAEFSSGQALGGHMRRHRPFPATIGRSQVTIEGKKESTSTSLSLTLDLNLPAEPDEEDEHDYKFSFSSRKQAIVFSASPLVGCQY